MLLHFLGYSAEHCKFFKDNTQRILFELMSSAKSRHFKADLAKAIKDLRGGDDGKEGSKNPKKKGIKAGTERKKRKSRGGKGRGKGRGGKGKKRKAEKDGEDDAEDDDEEADGDGDEDWVVWQLMLIIIVISLTHCASLSQDDDFASDGDGNPTDDDGVEDAGLDDDEEEDSVWVPKLNHENSSQ